MTFRATMHRDGIFKVSDEPDEGLCILSPVHAQIDLTLFLAYNMSYIIFECRYCSGWH